MEQFWDQFKQSALHLQHTFHNLLIQSYNQSAMPRERLMMNDLEDQQMQQAMALSLGENPNNRNLNFFPPPLPPTPNDFYDDSNTPEGDEEDEEEMLRRVMQESLREQGTGTEESANPQNSANNDVRAPNSNQRGILSQPTRLEDLVEFHNNDEEDDLERTIREIRSQRQSQKQQQKREQLRLEQEQAYEETLRMDTLKRQEEERKLREQQEREIEEKQKRELEEALQLSKELSRKSQVEKMRLEVPPEPAKTEKECVDIVVRLTDGTKVARRFRLENTLMQLKCWIASQGEEEKGEEGGVPERFSISSSFPRKKFEELGVTLREAGFAGSVLLFIEEEDEEN